MFKTSHVSSGKYELATDGVLLFVYFFPTWPPAYRISSPKDLLSTTLYSISSINAPELAKQRKSFEAEKVRISTSADSTDDERTRVLQLFSDIAQLSGQKLSLEHGSASNKTNWNCGRHDETSSEQIGNWLAQAKHDPSISSSTLESYEQQLRSKLDQEASKLEHADLYSRLLNEWLSPPTVSIGERATTQNDSLGDNKTHEIVERDRFKLLQNRFEFKVFPALETEEMEIDNYLMSFFPDEDSQKALRRLRAVCNNLAKRLSLLRLHTAHIRRGCASLIYSITIY